MPDNLQGRVKFCWCEKCCTGHAGSQNGPGRDEEAGGSSAMAQARQKGEGSGASRSPVEVRSRRSALGPASRPLWVIPGTPNVVILGRLRPVQGTSLRDFSSSRRCGWEGTGPIGACLCGPAGAGPELPAPAARRGHPHAAVKLCSGPWIATQEIRPRTAPPPLGTFVHFMWKQGMRQQR